MQQATDRQARSGPVPWAIRVGLSVGEVTFEDGDVFGPPVVEAARLVSAAGSGQIVTTGIVKALAGGRVETGFVDLGPLALKGMPQPVPACEVAWEPLPVSSVPFPGLLTDMGRIFVARESERLGQLWKEAAAGERRVALRSRPRPGHPLRRAHRRPSRRPASQGRRSHRNPACRGTGRLPPGTGSPLGPSLR